LNNTANTPDPPLMVPEFVRVNVVVAKPPPTSNVPLFWKVEPNSMFPTEEPIEPVEEAAPLKVRVPEVEVTVVPDCRVVRPITVRGEVAMLNVPLFTLSVPRTVELLWRRAEAPPELMITKLL
jgi:hypothetical protein